MTVPDRFIVACLQDGNWVVRIDAKGNPITYSQEAVLREVASFAEQRGKGKIMVMADYTSFLLIRTTADFCHT